VVLTRVLADKRVTVGLSYLFFCRFLCLYLPSLVGLAGLLFLLGRGGGVDLGGSTELDLYSVLLGPFKTLCDQSLGYPDVSVTLLVSWLRYFVPGKLTWC
jgi:hypothetical protein